MKHFFYFFVAVIILSMCSCILPKHTGNVSSLEGNVVTVANNKFEVYRNVPKIGQHVTFTPTHHKKKVNSRLLKQ